MGIPGISISNIQHPISNHQVKTGKPSVFHGMEKAAGPRCGKKGADFSTVWKTFAGFSTVWKKVFHGVENS
jgi:hypothetical protein